METPDPGREAAGSRGGIVVIVLAFGLLFGWLNVMILSHLPDRVRTLGFAPADATVVDSTVEEFRAGRRRRSGRVYDSVVRYAYAAGGTRYEGVHSGRSGGLTEGREAAERIVAMFPPGRAIAAWYDPQSPGESVIVRGVRGEDLFLVLIAVPLNLIAVSLFTTVGRGVWLGARPASWPGVRVRRRGGRLRLRLPVVRAWGRALVAAGATAVAAVILLGFGLAVVSATYVPVGLPVFGLWLTCLVGVVAFRRANRAFPAGRPVLTLDPAARVLHVPAVYAGQTPRAIPFDQVTSLRVDGRSLTTRKGEPEACYPILNWKVPGKTGGSVVLTAWPGSDWDGATRLVRWLETEVGVRARAQPEPKVGRRKRRRP